MNHKFLTFFIGLILCALQPALGESPRLIPFQGRLTDATGRNVADGSVLVRFQLFGEPNAGPLLWAGEVHRSTVNGGLINVILGVKNPFPIKHPEDDARPFFGSALYLQMTVDSNGDGKITDSDSPQMPRQAILPVVFAAESELSQDSVRLKGRDWDWVESRFLTLSKELSALTNELQNLKASFNSHNRSSFVRITTESARVLINNQVHGPALVSVRLNTAFYEARYFLIVWHNGFGGPGFIQKLATIWEFDQFDSYGFPEFSYDKEGGLIITNPRFKDRSIDCFIQSVDVGENWLP